MNKLLEEAKNKVSRYRNFCEKLPVRNADISSITEFFSAQLEYAKALLVLGHLQENENNFFEATKSYYHASCLIEKYELTEYLENIDERLFEQFTTTKHVVDVELSEEAKAEQDLAVLNIIALQHMSGIGVPRDFSLATAYWKYAHEKGSAEAKLFLHYCYDNDEDVIAAPEWTKQLLSEAASLGNAVAQLELSKDEFRRNNCKVYSRSHKHSNLKQLLDHSKEGCNCCFNAAAAHEQGYVAIYGSAESALQGSPMNVQLRLIHLFRSFPNVSLEKKSEIQALLLHMLSIKILLNDTQRSLVYFFASAYYLMKGKMATALTFYQRYRDLGCSLTQKIGRDLQCRLYDYIALRFCADKCLLSYHEAALECARAITVINFGDKSTLQECYARINVTSPVILNFTEGQIAKIRLDIVNFKIPEANTLLTYLHRRNCASASYHFYMLRFAADANIDAVLEYFILDSVKFTHYLMRDLSMSCVERCMIVIQFIDRLEKIRLSQNSLLFSRTRMLRTPSFNRIKSMMENEAGGFNKPLAEAQLILAEYLADELKNSENTAITNDTMHFISKITAVLNQLKYPEQYQERVGALKELCDSKNTLVMQPLPLPSVVTEKAAAVPTWNGNNHTHFRVSPARGNPINNESCTAVVTLVSMYESPIVV